MVQVAFLACYLVLTEHRGMIHYSFCVSSVPRHHHYPKVTYNHLHLQNHPIRNVFNNQEIYRLQLTIVINNTVPCISIYCNSIHCNCTVSCISIHGGGNLVTDWKTGQGWGQEGWSHVSVCKRLPFKKLNLLEWSSQSTCFDPELWQSLEIGVYQLSAWAWAILPGTTVKKSPDADL